MQSFRIQLQKHLPTLTNKPEFAFQLMFLLPLPSWFLKGDVTQDDSQRRFLALHSVAMLEQCCTYSKQFRNNVATLCCAKNRSCEPSRVTSP